VAKSKRETINVLTSEMKLQRLPFEPSWTEIADFLLPYRLRLHLSDYGRGDRRNNRIYDSTASKAMSTLGSGFMLSVTSPGSMWMRLNAQGNTLSEFGAEREWLDAVSLGMMDVFDRRSNLYTTLPSFYQAFAGFGTAAMSVEEDLAGGVVHFRTYPTGSYWIAQDERGTVDTFYREFRMTVRQVFEKFGNEGDYSKHLRDFMDEEKWEEWVDIAHIVYPNQQYTPGSRSPVRKRYSSCWFELGASSATGATGYGSQVENKIMLQKGFDEFPFLVARWDLVEGEVWGIDCPGMAALGDIKSLQVGEKRSWQAIEKHVNPHYIAPTSLRLQGTKGFLPGDTTWVDETQGMQGIRPLHEINPQIQELEAKLEQVRRRIYQTLFYDLFRAFDFLDPRKDVTATEIAERRNEKLAQLVPMLGQLNRAVLKPLIDRSFNIMWRQGLVEPPPPEMQGQNLGIEFLGILAQAQKATFAQPIERLFGSALSVAQATQNPEMLDKLDFDQAIDELGTAWGVPARVVRSDDHVAAIRQARAQQAQQQQALQAVSEGAAAAKNLAQAPMDEDNALSRLAGALGGAE